MTIKDPSNHKGIRILLNFLIEARIELGEFIPSIWQQRFAVFSSDSSYALGSSAEMTRVRHLKHTAATAIRGIDFPSEGKQ